jgi:hypothetical protein
MINEKAARVGCKEADKGPELMEEGGTLQRKSQGDIEKASKSTTKAKTSTIKKGIDGPELMESQTTEERKHRAYIGKSKSPRRSRSYFSPQSDHSQDPPI